MATEREGSSPRASGSYDVVVVGGGPAGLSAALALGRSRRRVLLCDAGPRRNAAATHVNNFLTRDGTPPAELRGIGRQQLEAYGSVEVREVGVEAIRGERSAFQVRLGAGEEVTARRVLLCTGMIDMLPELEGFAALWGKAIFICPYCHGWEVRDRRFGVLATSPELLELAVMLRAWTREVVVLTGGQLAVPPEVRARLVQAGIGIEERPIARLVADGDRLARVEMTGGEPVRMEILFARPPQRQVPVVQALGLALDTGGYLRVDERFRETSIPGIFAAGDLVTAQQSAIIAAASAMHAASALNHGLIAELAAAGLL